MTATKTRLMRCTEPHVCLLETERGPIEYAFRVGDELPADHEAVRAHAIYWSDPDAPPAGVAVEPDREPEREPLPPGHVRMRTRPSTKKKPTRVMYADPAGDHRIAYGNAQIIVTEGVAEQLAAQGLAERV